MLIVRVQIADILLHGRGPGCHPAFTPAGSSWDPDGSGPQLFLRGQIYRHITGDDLNVALCELALKLINKCIVLHLATVSKMINILLP